MTRSLEEIRRFFLADRFAVERAGIRIDSVDPVDGKPSARVVCSMPVLPHHCNAAGTVMGGAIFTLADFFSAVSANAYADATVTVSLSATIHYLGVCRSDCLLAKAEPVHDGRSTALISVRIEDSLGNLVALVDCTGYRKPIPANLASKIAPQS